jgi:hypothetical protein
VDLAPDALPAVLDYVSLAPKGVDSGSVLERNIGKLVGRNPLTAAREEDLKNLLLLAAEEPGLMSMKC